jgi:hypothetical protein
MVTVGVSVALQAEPGKEEEVASFLQAALPERASELLAHGPTIQEVDVLADKLPS